MSSPADPNARGNAAGHGRNLANQQDESNADDTQETAPTRHLPSCQSYLRRVGREAISASTFPMISVAE